MSQLVLDDQLDELMVIRRIRKWIKADRLQDLRPVEHIPDDRVPEILLTLRQPTFVTIDHHFSHPSWCHPHYCILYFALRDREQRHLSELLRELLHLAEFRTRAARVGKLARVSMTTIEYWQYPIRQSKRIAWERGHRNR